MHNVDRVGVMKFCRNRANVHVNASKRNYRLNYLRLACNSRSTYVRICVNFVVTYLCKNSFQKISFCPSKCSRTPCLIRRKTASLCILPIWAEWRLFLIVCLIKRQQCCFFEIGVSIASMIQRKQWVPFYKTLGASYLPLHWLVWWKRTLEDFVSNKLRSTSSSHCWQCSDLFRVALVCSFPPFVAAVALLEHLLWCHQRRGLDELQNKWHVWSPLLMLHVIAPDL